MTIPQDIIADCDIDRVHGNANFGGISPRRVVDEGVLKAAFQYHHGSTARSILLEHGLMSETGGRRSYRDMRLTAKGRDYMRALFPKEAIKATFDLLGCNNDPLGRAVLSVTLCQSLQGKEKQMLSDAGLIYALRPGQKTMVLNKRGIDLARLKTGNYLMKDILKEVLGPDVVRIKEYDEPDPGPQF